MNWKLQSPDWLKNAASVAGLFTVTRSAASESYVPIVGMSDSAMPTKRWEPNKDLVWYEQVLDLEAKGKPTSPAAHDLAMDAKRIRQGQRGTPGDRVPGEDWEESA
jgi:hypothetical protein